MAEKKVGKKMDNPLVSIVLPAYNEGNHIGECIESLLNQSYKNIEIFIVDDESKDNTVEVVEKYVPKVTLLKQKHLGPGAAWNLGFKHAKGDIFMFWASDHVYGKDYIKDLVKPIADGEALRTIHAREDVANFGNLWARAWGHRDWRILEKGGSKNASLTAKEVYIKSNGFDPNDGYADDQSLYGKTKVFAKILDTKVSHYNPESLSESFAQNVWVGASYKKPYLIFLSLPLFLFYVIARSAQHFIREPYLPFLFFLPVFYTVKYFGYFFGALRRVFLKKNTRI
ncbi:MAG: glycosyltransferase [Nanoarchaeota archaeon]|nr:glycosyltransferase [Nanoarchaeota archaeon]